MKSEDQMDSLERNEANTWMLTKGVAIVGVTFSLYHIVIILNVFERLGLGSISAISHRAISLCLILLLVLMLYPFKEFIGQG